MHLKPPYNDILGTEVQVVSFIDLKIENEYRSLIHNVVKDFYTPLLAEACLYQRAVGFFSSSSLISMTEGIKGLLQNQGRIEVVASPRLTEEDLEAIEDGLKRRDDVILESLIRDLDAPRGKFEEARLNLLSNLIASGVMKIKIALLDTGEEIGMFHEKLGLMYDDAGNVVAFSGSMNETANAFFRNYEAFDVFTSWSNDADRVASKQAAFSAMWENREAGIRVIEVPQVAEAIIKKYRLRDGVDLTDLDVPDDLEKAEPSFGGEPCLRRNVPRIPGNVQLRGYQLEAIDAWERNRYRGVYDMATGTGKTFTGLASVCRLSEALGDSLAVVIVCPYQHLVDQWVEDIVAFNIDPIIGYSSSPQKDWEKRLDNAIRDQKYGVAGAEFLCFVCTNGTYSTKRVQALLDKIKKPKLLVVDEAHNFGAEYLRSLLRPDFLFRLALSATIERYGDEDGTAALFSYFGPRCIEYTLEEAIYGRGDEPPCLTPYRYHPVVVYLEADELQEYSQLSRQIAKAIVSKNGKKKLSERGKQLVLKRARLVAAAHQKLAALKREVTPYAQDDYMLVYCGATKVEVENGEIAGVDDYETRQIDAVTHILGDELNMRVRQFTSRENSAEREEIKTMFANADLQALIAIKCLDEGVNIPMIKTAFILASTANPREYVQRRGRLLRKDRLGLKRRAGIYDFITLSRPADEAAFLTEEDLHGERRLACNELIRAKEFASLAENRAQVTQIIDEIEEAFFGDAGIAGFEKEKEVD
jgi:superfamily II DNA or RNA helicase